MSKFPARGDVAIVLGATRPALQPVALVLAGRGVRLILAGEDERALAELVGEIAFGGGKARHVVGPLDATTLEQARKRAAEAFAETVHVVVQDTDPELSGAPHGLAFHRAHNTICDVPTATRWIDVMSQRE